MLLLEQEIDDNISLPNNIVAEQKVISSLMINNNALDQVADFLLAEHFYHPLHNRIYQQIISLVDRGLLADYRVLYNIFKDDPAFSSTEISSNQYFEYIATLEFTAVNIKDYAREIYNHSLKRNLYLISKNIAQKACENSPHYDAANKLEQAEQSLFQLASDGIGDSKFKHYRSYLSNAVNYIKLARQNKRGITGVSTGFKMLDHYLCGFQNSDLLILAGRPSMGKTAFAINLTLNAAISFKNIYDTSMKDAEVDKSTLKQPGVAFFSLEMSAEQLCTRMLSMRSQIHSEVIRRGEVDFDKISTALRELEQYNIYIDDTPALSISALRTRARRAQRQHNVGLIVVDYLQLLRGSNNKETNRVQEVSEITQGLKAIAKELNLPVIALSQLSRAVEQREDKRPLLSDLRESGSIEQDADIVMFIYRDAYYKRRMKNSKLTEDELMKLDKECDIIIAKQRNGPIGDVKIAFNGNVSTFTDHKEYMH